ncbi:uncharacterized protein THITE_108782 [Thermothielavioides terrestris NRRL 8126]|jgi:hypothetical protein|uniref:Uncharacterized protein n=1 Tax=Thermothielavioides terrestris (strain ATCC 38088 / NRRL 8126) TaxID=578455 RepID=G2RCE1_THETT|nr:uncharacterized protein THITE_108782 [Thermothielavioides terrestris NRRL 8126]AEO70576.1 hypothetical protein THITE_108782 [Thermothielavioides terrestris NRRL 8126]
MRPVVRDTLSLRPPGFFGYAFLVARLVQIASLTTIIALVSHFIFVITRARQDNKPPGNLIVVILFVSPHRSTLPLSVHHQPGQPPPPPFPLFFLFFLPPY